ncbi:early transcribed membrane protein [Plasmodium vinckei vinckei]|uniref:Early transcribed membrane protein n=1 Tax=Plasmodium vinckei vinckei TaxID=54757 RepID=A0A449BRZ4_PLAVN|nr:early transcribed membrane protein [Plasmodium vinckei vinckei]VEV56214.1 early transcribed membrane protein [Plasmodium vinckei vinckei]
MKLTKAFYFIAFLLAINVLVPGSNNYVEAKPKGKGGNSLANKIKNNKAAVISTILTTLALAAAGTYGALHYHKKGAPKKKPAVQNTKAAPAPDNKAAPKPAGTTTPTRAYPPGY